MTAADEAIGRRIADARRSAGISQEELAVRMRAAGIRTVRQITVSRLELGEQRLKLSEASELARQLGTTVDYLAGDGAEPKYGCPRCISTEDTLAAALAEMRKPVPAGR